MVKYKAWAMAVVIAAEATAHGETDAKNDAFLQQVQLHFSQWDTNHDGTLSKDEISVAAMNHSVRGAEAAAVSALERASRSKKYDLPTLTPANIVKLVESKKSSSRPDLGAMYASGLERIENANHALFASKKPRLDTIHQGKLGNCFCLAPLAAVLHTTPDRVTAMFHPRSNGEYLVTFGPRKVIVTAPTDAEIAQTSSNENDGMWINLYEKAIGQSRLMDKPDDEREGSAIDAMARGGSAGTMLAYITGHKIQRFSCSWAKDDKHSVSQREQIMNQMRQYLSAAVKHHQPMTCGTLSTTTPGITPNHAYAVLGYDAKSDRIALWNPHGTSYTPKGPEGLEHGYARQDGTFSMPLHDFVQQFAGLAVETDQPVDQETELPKLPLTGR